MSGFLVSARLEERVAGLIRERGVLAAGHRVQGCCGFAVYGLSLGFSVGLAGKPVSCEMLRFGILGLGRLRLETWSGSLV